MQLDFNLIGILSRLSSILSKRNISIFAVSTFDTDYILVMEHDADNAVNALCMDGYNVTKLETDSDCM